MKLQKGQGQYCDELSVIGDGNQTYVWVGKDGNCVCNFSGPETLRRLATDILKALRKPQRRKVK